MTDLPAEANDMDDDRCAAASQQQHPGAAMTVPTAAIEAAEAACPDEHISLGHWERKLSRAEILRVLEAAAPHILAAASTRLKNETADEYTQICAQTVLEAVAAERQRIRQLAIDKRAAYAVRHGEGRDAYWADEPFADLLLRDQPHPAGADAQPATRADDQDGDHG